ncbi:MAG TPA: hypothetical protein ENI08_01270 [Candidatus Dependentiae bacterium]|nr:hypothetical protein [Candidatus Dependentiae bacterium]
MNLEGGENEKLIREKELTENDTMVEKKGKRRTKRKSARRIARPKKKYIYAFDPKIKKTVLHIVSNTTATSTISGTVFTYQPSRKRKRD